MSSNLTLETVSLQLAGNNSFDLDCCIERDTKDLTGAPDIIDSIFRKIDGCDAFVADVSIVSKGKQNEDRSFPNPNVLLELGYAIRHLGWERIFLFYNKEYGPIEALPFDLRAHKCISYKLPFADDKSASRAQLASILKKQFSQIANKPHANSTQKSPRLEPLWRFRNDPMPRVEYEWTTSETVQVVRATGIQQTIYLAREDARIESHAFPRFDRNWKSKVSAYKEAVENFIEKLKDPLAAANYIMRCEAYRSSVTTLGISNAGTTRATNVRLKLELPQWLYVYEKEPEGRMVPERPKMPQPSISTFGNLGNWSHPITSISPSLLVPKLSPPTYGCGLNDNTLSFWVDRVLHKHEWFARKDTIHLLAHSDATLGMHRICVSVFCEEYDDWQDRELFIEVLDGELDSQDQSRP